MAEVDEVSLKIESDAKRANGELDLLIAKLGAVSEKIGSITGNKSVQNMTAQMKSVNASMKQVSQSAKQTAESIAKPMTQATKSVSEQIASLKDKYKNLGKDTNFLGSSAKLNKDLESFKNSLAKVNTTIQSHEIKGDVYSTMFENAISKASELKSYIAHIEKELQTREANIRGRSTAQVQSQAQPQAQPTIANINTANITEFKASVKDAIDLMTDLAKNYNSAIGTIGEKKFFETASVDSIKDANNYIEKLGDSISKIEGFNLIDTKDIDVQDRKLGELETRLEELTQVRNKLQFNRSYIDAIGDNNSLRQLVSGGVAESINKATDSTVKDIESAANKLREQLERLSSIKVQDVSGLQSSNIQEMTGNLERYVDAWFKSKLGIAETEKALKELRDFQYKADEIQTPFGENQKQGLELVRQKAKEVYDEMTRTIGKFKPTELGIGEAYSKEFLKAQKEVEKLEKRLDELKNRQARREYQGLGVTKGMEYDLKITRQRIREYKEQMVELQRTGDDVISKQAADFKDLSDSISNTGTVLSRFATVFRALGMTDIAAPLQKWSRVANQAGSAVGEMGSKAQAAGATASAAMGKASTAASGFMSKIAAGASKFGYVGIAIAAVITAIMVRMKMLKAELSLVKKGVTALAKGFTSLWSAVGKVGKSILSIGSNGYQAITPIGKAINKIIGIFKTRVLRQALSKAFSYVNEGFEKLNEYSKNIGSDFHGNMSMLYSDLKLLGRTIATAFEPLINVAAPILDFIIRKVIDLINVINQAFAAITGAESWTKATYALEEWGEAASKAGSSAKKAAKQLGAFDEINNITTNEPGSGGGGGGADAISVENMFTTENINEKIKAYMDKIKEAWETNADFTFVGTDLGTQIKDWLDGIDWTGIQETAKKVGKAFATMLNGLFEVPNLAETIGKTISGAINTAISGLTGFLENLHFDSIGKFIGTAIGTAIDTIHWDEFIGDMSTLGEGLAKGINALLQTGVLSKIAKATANLLKAGIAGAYQFITTTDFVNAGVKFGDAITEFFSTMNEVDASTGLTAFQELGKGITDLSHGIAEFVVNAVNNIDDEEIKQGFRDFFESLDFTSILLDCAIIVSQIELGLGSLIWDGVTGFFEGNSDSLADDIEFVFGDSLQKGIDNAIDFVTFPYKVLWDTIKKGLGNIKISATWLWDKIKTGWYNIQTSSDWLVEKVGGAVKTGLDNIRISATWLWDKIKTGWQNIQTSSDWIVQKVGGAIQTGIGNIRISATWLWDKLKAGWENLGDVAGQIRMKLQTAWDNVKRWWDGVKTLSNVNVNIPDIRGKIQTAWNNVTTWWRNNNLLSQIRMNAPDILGTVRTAWNNLVNWWNNHKPNLSAISANIKLPHLNVTWNTTGAAAKALQKLGLNGFPNFSVQYYAQGGFPEDGWFRANHGEIMGQFDNGKSVVANNEQITTGIANAVYKGNQESNALLRQEITAIRQQNEILQRILEKETGISSEALFDSVRRSADEYYRTKGSPAFSM